VNTVYALRLSSKTLLEILEEFPEIKEELKVIAHERESVRFIQGGSNYFLSNVKKKILKVMEGLIDEEISKQKHKLEKLNTVLSARTGGSKRRKSHIPRHANINSTKILTYEEVRKSKEGAMNMEGKKNLLDSVHEKIEFFKVAHFDSGVGETGTESCIDKYVNAERPPPIYSQFLRKDPLIPEAQARTKDSE